MLRFLYATASGRLTLKLLTTRGVSRVAGKFMDSRASRALIGPFVRKNGIDLSEYVPARYASFNEFFTRRVRPECRPIDFAPDALIAPCDGRLSAYRITDQSEFRIKNSVYSVQTLLGNDPRASHFRGGTCLVFRLCVDDYHRYHFFDDCTIEPSRFIPGVLHTVRPIALEHTDVFHQNCRETTFLHTAHFGLAAQIEVGAMLVGRICNHPPRPDIRRGDEKGCFLYGGSTVVLLLPPNAARFPESLFEDTARGLETRVKMGQRLSI